MFKQINVNIQLFAAANALSLRNTLTSSYTLQTVRGSNPGGGRDFPHPSRLALERTQPPI